MTDWTQNREIPPFTAQPYFATFHVWHSGPQFTILSDTLTKMNVNRRNWFCCLVLSKAYTVNDELEFQLTKTGDKARNWMTMFQNWSTRKDEIETSIRTFQSVRDEIKTHKKIWIKMWRKWAGKPLVKSNKHNYCGSFINIGQN